MSRAARIIEFVERYLRVPEGKDVGQPMVLADFQKQFIVDVFDNPHGTRRAILSQGRKEGKTALIAAILAAFIVGPEARQNATAVSGALSREQASLVFRLCCLMIQQSPKLAPLVRVIPSGKRIIGLPMNVEYRAMSAEAKTAMGASPLLIIGDEWGQVRGPQDDFIDSLLTSQGAHENPLQIIISTQAASDADWLIDRWSWGIAQLAGEAQPVDVHDAAACRALGLKPHLNLVAVQEFFFARAGRVIAELRCYPRDYHRGVLRTSAAPSTSPQAGAPPGAALELHTFSDAHGGKTMNAALQSQLEILLWKGTLLALLGTAISYMALMWSAFTVLKYGVKEGLLAYDREKRKPGWSKTAAVNTAPGIPPSGFKWVLVPDEALPHSAMPMVAGR